MHLANTCWYWFQQQSRSVNRDKSQLPTRQVNCCQHAIHTAIEGLFRCIHVKTSRLLFDDTSEHVVSSILRMMNSLEIKSSTVRMALPPNVTSLYQKFFRLQDTSQLLVESAVVIMTSPEILTVLLSRDEFRRIITPMSRQRIMTVFIVSCNGALSCAVNNSVWSFTPAMLAGKAVVASFSGQLSAPCSHLQWSTESCRTDIHKIDFAGRLTPWKCSSGGLSYMATRGIMAGRHLVASTNQWPPFVVRKPGSKGGTLYEGFCIDIWTELAEALHFTFEFVEPSDGEWGRLINGSWTGLVGQLQRKEVDAAVAPLSAQPARSGVMDFSHSYLQLDGKLLIKRRTVDNFQNLLYIFSGPVLFLTAVCPLVVALLLTGVEKLLDTPGGPPSYIWPNEAAITRPADAMALTYGAVVSQASVHRPKSTSGRTLVAFWWLFAIVFVNTFSAVMIANLAVTSTKNSLNTLADLVDQTEYSWGMLGSTIFPRILSTSNNTVFQRLWEGISRLGEDQPDILSNDFAVHLDKMRTQKYAYLGPVPALDFYNTSHCEFNTGKDSFFTARYVLGLQKNSPFTDIISRQLLDFEERGILLAITRRWFHVPATCDHQVYHKSTTVQLSHLTVAFFAFGTGILCSGVVLLVEIIINIWRKCVRISKWTVNNTSTST